MENIDRSATMRRPSGPRTSLLPTPSLPFDPLPRCMHDDDDATPTTTLDTTPDRTATARCRQKWRYKHGTGRPPFVLRTDVRMRLPSLYHTRTTPTTSASHTVPDESTS